MENEKDLKLRDSKNTSDNESQSPSFKTQIRRVKGIPKKYLSKQSKLKQNMDKPKLAEIISRHGLVNSYRDSDENQPTIKQQKQPEEPKTESRLKKQMKQITYYLKYQFCFLYIVEAIQNVL
ncbi:hypothetical protein ABPG72_007701 [Tetrahymena utriculariae]